MTNPHDQSLQETRPRALVKSLLNSSGLCPRPHGFPVLLYHAIAACDAMVSGTAWERKYWVTKEHFGCQMRLVRAVGFKAQLLEELWRRPGRALVEPRQVAISFDDGHASDYEIALPILLQAGCRATFFVNTGTVMTDNYLTWSQIDEMQRLGMSFQSHGHQHLSLPRLSEAELRRQLVLSKHVLEERLGRAVNLIAAPYGEYDRRVVRAAMDVGYNGVCTTHSWAASPQEPLLHRICIYQHTSVPELYDIMSLDPGLFTTRALRSALLYVPRRVRRMMSVALMQ